MHKYIHEYDNEWGYFVKIDDDVDEEKYMIIDEYEEEDKYNKEDKCKYKYYNKENKENKEDKKLVQYNKYENINKSLFIYFVVTVLIYISYAFSLTYKKYIL
jgi:hypothetical protein